MTLALASFAFAAAGIAVPPAQPAAVAYELRWERAAGAESCIDADELAGAVSAWLGREVFHGAGERTVVIDGRIAPAADGWRAAIAIRDVDGAPGGARELELHDADCRAIDESLVLVLGLIIDPGASGGAAPVVTITSTPAPAPARPWHVDAVLGGAAAIGVTPEVGGGARWSVTVDPPGTWPIVLGGGWWAAGQVDTAEPDRRIAISRWELGAMLSTPAWRRGRLRLSLAGGGALALLEARGIGFERDRATVVPMGLGLVAGRAALDLGRAAFVTADAGAAVHLTRPIVVDLQGTEVHRASPGSLYVGLGVGVRI